MQESDGTRVLLQDYRRYRLTAKDRLQAVSTAAIGSAVISILFYNCIWGILIMPILFLVIKRRKEKEAAKKRQEEITRQFLDAIRVVSSALFAGFSMENAWIEAQKEIENLYGEKSILYSEISKINRKVAMSVPIEGLIFDFATRTGVEDILSFAEVFRFAKRSGGDMVKIIDTTVRHMKEKQETMQEIEILIAAKRMEQKVMGVIPIFILAYLRLTSDGYLDILYGNPVGIIFMSCALGAYLFATYMAEKIMNITV